jgi:hypothetical protein
LATILDGKINHHVENDMRIAHQHLGLDQLTPGMTLSDDLIDRQGQVLLRQGTVLSEQIINLLPRHGIERVSVICEQPAGAAADPAAVAARLDWLFRKAERPEADNWGSQVLRGYMEDYRLDREVNE